MPTTLLFPVMVWVATVFIYTYFVIVLWYLASAGSWDAAQHRYIWNEDLQRLMVLTFSKVSSIVTLHRKCTRALTSENFRSSTFSEHYG